MMKIPKMVSSDHPKSLKENEIPEGWKGRKLKEIFDWSNGKSLPNKKIDQGEFPVFGGNGINGYHSKYLIEKECLVIGRVGASCGNVHLAPKKSWITDNAIYTSEYPDSTNLKFYFFLLKYLDLNKVSGGSGQPFISQTILDEIYIAQPPASEQHRIVARIEALLSQVNAARDRLNRVPLIMKRFRQAVLAAACCGRLTEGWREDKGIEQELSWKYLKLEDIGKWSTGGTPSRKQNSFFNGEIPWIKSGDLKDGVIFNPEERITNEGLDNSNAKLLPIGTISIALYGATIGKVGILGIEAATNQACANCIVDNEKIFGRYLFYYLIRQRQNFIDIGQGGAQPNLTNKIVHQWPLNLPPILEQYEIVRRVDALFALADQIEREVTLATTRTGALTQAVLAKAFRGELVEREAEITRKG